MNGITSIGLGNYVTQLPTVNAIAYPSILWNKQTNQGVSINFLIIFELQINAIFSILYP